MTELETHLLNALKSLEEQFKKQQSASDQGQQELQRMFEHTSQENAKLKAQVANLSKQVEGLNNQLTKLAMAFKK